MTDLEKARQLFHDAGLAFPTIPERFAAGLRERRRWRYATREVTVWPYFIQRYVAEFDEGGAPDYLLLSHEGHGVNSYAMHYFVVDGALGMFLQMSWGGVYMDA